MNPLERIRLHEKEFTKQDRIIMEYIIENLDVVASFPLLIVAEKANVSKSALLRFTQRCGYEGFSEFKYEVARYILSGQNDDTSSSDSTSALIAIYTATIAELETINSESQMKELASLIQSASKIKIYGVHETGLAAQYLSYRLLALGIDSEAIVSPNVMNEKAGFSVNSDLNIYLSLSATTECIVESAQGSLANKAKTVLISQNDRAKFRNELDAMILIPMIEKNKNQLFVDAQAIVFIIIDILINTLARTLKR